jgi:hypothetical protein
MPGFFIVRTLSRDFLMFLFVAGVMASLAGCDGGGTAPAPPTGKVSGKVTYKGAPVKGAMIQFNDPKGGTSPMVDVADDGSYSIGSLRAVEYIVAFAPKKAAAAQEQKTAEMVDPQKMAEMLKTPVIDVPEKYKSASTSDLKAKIEADKENKFDFDLKD